MSIIRNIVHGREYGNEGKKSWTKCGILIEKEGRFFVKLENLPLTGGDDDGIFFSVFDQDHNKDKEASQQTPADNDDLDDDIPF